MLFCNPFILLSNYIMWLFKQKYYNAPAKRALDNICVTMSCKTNGGIKVCKIAFTGTQFAILPVKSAVFCSQVGLF